jgi:hypothetical protein
MHLIAMPVRFDRTHYFVFLWCGSPHCTETVLFRSFFTTHTHTHTHTHSVGFLWTSDQLVLEAATCTTKHNMNVNALSKTRICDRSNQAAADLLLKPHSHQDRQNLLKTMILLHIAACSSSH